MTHHPHPARTGSIWTGLLARLRERLAGRSRERGDVMVEVIIFMGVISLVAGSYTNASNSATAASRSMTAIDTVNQQAQGVLEQAQVQPWETLGFNFGDQSTPTGYSQSEYDDEPIVRHGETNDGDAALSLQPHVEITTRGVEMEQSTYITWTDNPAGTPAGAYGTKKVTVVIEYHAPGVPGTKSKTFSTTRTSTPSEAVPTSVADIDDARDPANNVGDLGACPQVYLRERAPATLHWDRVSGADGYYVKANGNPLASGNRLTGTSLNLTDQGATNWGTAKFEVEPVFGDVRIDCEPVTPAEWTNDPPDCPTGLIFAADGKTLSWSPTHSATSYTVKQRLDSNVTTIVANHTTTSYTLASRPTGSEFQIIAHNNIGTSTGCTTWTAPTPAPPPPPPPPVPVPGCPTNVRFTGSDTIAWTPVSGATSYVIVQRVDYSVPGRFVKEVSGGSTSSTSGLANAFAYDWQVLAKNSSGTSTCSTWVTGPPRTERYCFNPARTEYYYRWDAMPNVAYYDFDIYEYGQRVGGGQASGSATQIGPVAPYEDAEIVAILGSGARIYAGQCYEVPR